MKKHLRHKKMK